MHNNKRTKIIELSSYDPDKIESFPEKGSDMYYVASWAGLVARRLKKRYPDLGVEVWRAEPEFDEISEKEIFGGIKGKIFPYRRPIVPKTLTMKMIRELRNMQNRYRLIIDYHSVFNFYFNFLAPQIVKKAKIVLHHRGGRPPKKDGFKKFLKRFLLEHSYGRISEINYRREEVKNWIINKYPNKKLNFLVTGADFSKFQPIDQSKARSVLGLKDDMVYSLSVGPFIKEKGAHNILNILKTHQEIENDKYKHIFVGGSKEDQLHEDVKESGNPFFYYQKWERMKYFYSAADFYLQPIFKFTRVGFDTSLIESWACNTPVVSTQLKELDFPHDELGFQINDKSELTHKVKAMINNYKEFDSCREVAKKHLDGNTVITDKLYRILTRS